MEELKEGESSDDEDNLAAADMNAARQKGVVLDVGHREDEEKEQQQHETKDDSETDENQRRQIGTETKEVDGKDEDSSSDHNKEIGSHENDSHQEGKEEEDTFESSTPRQMRDFTDKRATHSSFLMSRSTSEQAIDYRTRGLIGPHYTFKVPFETSIASSTRQSLQRSSASSQSIDSPDPRRFSGFSLTSGSGNNADLSSRLRTLTSKDISKLASFVPQQLLSILQRESEVRMMSKSSHALVMLADISGFTSLSENLCSRGAEGVDELSEIISDFLGALIETVQSYEGDIVAFAGDALIITWVTTSTTRIEQTLRVFKCGMELAALTRPQLTLHIGIASGKTHFTIIGGTDESWNWLVIGEAIVRMGDAEGHASSQEVVATLETYEPVKDFCTVEEVEEKREDVPNAIGSFNRKRGLVKLIDVKQPETFAWRPSHGASWGVAAGMDKVAGFQPRQHHIGRARSEMTGSSGNAEVVSFVERLRKFIPVPAIEVLRAGGRYVNEYRKRICVLFMMLDGFPVDIYDADSDGETLARVFHELLGDLQQVLFSYNGLLRQFLVDDKGCVFIACFGVAGYTHRDDSARALACGLEMARVAEARSIRSFTGLSTGAAFCGTVGSTSRREYAMVGRDVNLAARLMSLSRKRALQEGSESFSMLICNEDTYAETKNEQHVKFTALDPVRLKGYENAVQTYLCEPREDDGALRELSFSSNTETTELFGRAGEFNQIMEAARSAAAGQPQVCTIYGEQGIGKTHLAIHLKHRLENEGFVTISYRAFSATQSSPYAIFQQIFWQLLAQAPQADPDVADRLAQGDLSKEDLDEHRQALFQALMERVDETEELFSSAQRLRMARNIAAKSSNSDQDKRAAPLARKSTFAHFTTQARGRPPPQTNRGRTFLRSTTNMFLGSYHKHEQTKTTKFGEHKAADGGETPLRPGAASKDDPARNEVALVSLAHNPSPAAGGRRTSAPSILSNAIEEDEFGAPQSSSMVFEQIGQPLDEAKSESRPVPRRERTAPDCCDALNETPSKDSLTAGIARANRIDRIARPVLSQVLNAQWAKGTGRKTEEAASRRPSLPQYKSLDAIPSHAVVMQNLRKILRVLLRGYIVETHKVAIFVDDVQYMDSLSGKALLELAQVAQGQLVLVFTKEELPSPKTMSEWLQLLCENSSITDVHLSALDTKTCLKLVKAAAGDHELKQKALDFIIDQGRGNPGRCEELARSLAASSESDLVENTTINVVLERAVQARFDLLADTHRALLKTAAVIGFCFPMACLRDTVPRCISRKGAHMLNEVIEDLVDSEWLETTTGPNAETMYAFRSQLAREVCYNLNTSRNLKMLHLSVAQFYQKTYDEDLRPYFAVLAHHYQCAHSDAMALKFMMYSFRMNIAIGALPEAYAIIEGLTNLNLGRSKLFPALTEMKELVGEEAHMSMGGQELAVVQSPSSGAQFAAPVAPSMHQVMQATAEDKFLETRYGYSAMMSKIEIVRKDVNMRQLKDLGSSMRSSSSKVDPDSDPKKRDLVPEPSAPQEAPSKMCAIL